MVFRADLRYDASPCKQPFAVVLIILMSPDIQAHIQLLQGAEVSAQGGTAAGVIRQGPGWILDQRVPQHPCPAIRFRYQAVRAVPASHQMDTTYSRPCSHIYYAANILLQKGFR
jgi:hypothetical protein